MLWTKAESFKNKAWKKRLNAIRRVGRRGVLQPSFFSEALIGQTGWLVPPPLLAPNYTASPLAVRNSPLQSDLRANTCTEMNKHTRISGPWAFDIL